MMILKSVSTDQFAGLRTVKKVEFDPKLTILYGKNEAGKSSLINLIYCALWQDCKVGYKGKSDKIFRSQFMPSRNQAATVNGRIEFQDEAGDYYLEKTWNENGSVTFDTPDGRLNEKDYKGVLERVLGHKKSVYYEIIFANQHSIETVIQNLMQGGLESGKELATVATELMLELDGVPTEAFLLEVQEKLNNLRKSWDVENDQPVKEGRIKQNVGKILEAYYSLNDTEDELNNLKELVEKQLECERAYSTAEIEYQSAREKREAFDRAVLRGNKGAQADGLIGTDSTADLLQRMVEAEKNDWEEGTEIRAVRLEKYAKDAAAGILMPEKVNEILENPEEDLAALRELENSIARKEDNLRNFHACIRFAMNSGMDYHVYSELDGMEIFSDNGSLDTSEAVRIEISGVGTIHLDFPNLNPQVLRDEIRNSQQEIQVILSKYHVSSQTGLENICDRIQRVRAEQELFIKENEREMLVKEEIQKQKLRDDARTDFDSAKTVLQTKEQKENFISIAELEELVEERRDELGRLKKEYHAWEHILNVASRILEEAKQNPLDELEVDFRKYLHFLSDGRLTFDKLNRDLSSCMYSSNNQLTYELLSDGTKDTIALAFRLAAVDLLYPDGGGVVVFDDPFTDMDEERRARACELVNQFAEKNQVIFATCDRRYAELLHGSVVEMPNG